jgi:hypothetical protein
VNACADGPAAECPPAAEPIAITLDPAPAAWPGLLADEFQPREDQRRFRAELGLPTDRPIVASGHQAEFWHPGILAKLFAAQSVARPRDAAVVWLIVDQDTADPFVMDLPALDPAGRLRTRRWQPDAAHGAHAAMLSRPAIRPEPVGLPAGWTLPGPIEARVSAVVSALATHADAPDAVAQSTGAMLDLLGPVLPGARPLVVRARDVAQTSLFSEIVDRARADAASMHRVYNAAAASVPDAGVRPLGTHASRGPELPFWVRTKDGRRAAAYSADLHDPDAALLPRGLLATGLLRLAGCELFVHGLGGRAYEPINDAWLARWLRGEDTPALAPFACATADLRLALPGAAATRRDAHHARWLANHARHHPGAVGDDASQAERDALVARIDAEPRRRDQRAALYQRLQGLLRSHRERSAGAIAALDARARDLTSAAEGEAVRTRRDFAAVLHEPDDLRRLADRIDAAFAG